MPKFLVWNKKHDKVAIYSTISDGFVTDFASPDDKNAFFGYQDLIKREVKNICPYCEGPMEPRKKSDYELEVTTDLKIP